MRRIGLPATAVALAVLFTACGGEQQAATTTVTEPGATTAAGPTGTTQPAPTTTGGNQPGPEDPSGLPEMTGGSATLTVAGETEEFDWFVCFTGDAVELLEDDEDLTFLAVGRRGGSFPSMEGVEAQIIVAQEEPDLIGTQHTVFYTRVGSDGAETSWQSVVEQAVEIDGGRVTFEGEMEPIIDGQASSEGAEPGSLEATCSPNSVGS